VPGHGQSRPPSTKQPVASASVSFSVSGRETLVRQLDAELRPVLRQTDFDDFDLDAALRTVNRLAEAVDNLRAVTVRVVRR